MAFLPILPFALAFVEKFVKPYGFVALLDPVSAHVTGNFVPGSCRSVVAFALRAAASAIGFGVSGFWCLLAPIATITALLAAELP
jgi:hypothetical protein